MPLPAGSRLPASALANLVRSVQADGTTLANASIGTTYVDIPGTSLPFTIFGANAYVIVHQSVDISPTSTNSGQLFVIRAAWAGGTVQDAGGQIVVGDKTGRGTPSRSHKVNLAAGTYTFTQQISKTSAAITGDVLSSSLLISIFDIP